MTVKKTTLPSLRNQDWKKVKVETEKVNKLLINIPTNNISEQNDLIHTRGKLIRNKIGIPKGARTKIQEQVKEKNTMIC